MPRLTLLQVDAFVARRAPASLTPEERVLRRRVRRDMGRGLTTGSRAYRLAMLDAETEYRRWCARRRTAPATVPAVHGVDDQTQVAIDRELDTSRLLGDGLCALRANGTVRGIATRFGAPARLVA